MSLSFVSLRVLDQNRRWVEFNDHISYVLEASTFNETSVTWRRQTTESPYIGGRFLVHAVEDTVEESAVIYIYGQDQVDLEDNIQKAISTFTQTSYIMEFVLDESRKQFECEMADYSISRPRELTHNNMAILNLRIPRFPEFDRSVDY